jgi:hypothetical protein
MLSILDYEDVFTKYLNRKSFEQNNKIYVLFSRKNDIIDERILDEYKKLFK